uniref:Uncharacterized protein n=1 Tax=Anguilla anguilla TaxID=7936 RepID=A0A0E9UYC0_ANGAN
MNHYSKQCFMCSYLSISISETLDLRSRSNSFDYVYWIKG